MGEVQLGLLALGYIRGPSPPVGVPGAWVLCRHWDATRKYPSVEPHSFVPKIAETDSVFETGRIMGSA